MISQLRTISVLAAHFEMLCYSQSKYIVEHSLVSTLTQLGSITMKVFLSRHTETYTERLDGELETCGGKWVDK